MLEDKVKEIEKRFDEGRAIFSRSSIEILLAYIQQLEVEARRLRLQKLKVARGR